MLSLVSSVEINRNNDAACNRLPCPFFHWRVCVIRIGRRREPVTSMIVNQNESYWSTESAWYILLGHVILDVALLTAASRAQVQFINAVLFVHSQPFQNFICQWNFSLTPGRHHVTSHCAHKNYCLVRKNVSVGIGTSFTCAKWTLNIKNPSCTDRFFHMGAMKSRRKTSHLDGTRSFNCVRQSQHFSTDRLNCFSFTFREK